MMMRREIGKTKLFTVQMYAFIKMHFWWNKMIKVVEWIEKVFSKVLAYENNKKRRTKCLSKSLCNIRMNVELCGFVWWD